KSRVRRRSLLGFLLELVLVGLVRCEGLEVVPASLREEPRQERRPLEPFPSPHRVGGPTSVPGASAERDSGRRRGRVSVPTRALPSPLVTSRPARYIIPPMSPIPPMPPAI